MAVQVERPWDWVAKLCWESKEMGWKWPIKYSKWSLQPGIVWSLQRPSPKSKPKGASYFILCSKLPLQSNGQDLINDWFLNEKIDGLSTIVWISIHVWPKLPSRVRHLHQKVIILKYDGLWTLTIVWRVERPNSWFLIIWLVEIDILSTFGHSVEGPLGLTIRPSCWPGIEVFLPHVVKCPLQ
jgi:hypothetical protein